MGESTEGIIARFRSREAQIAIIGLGYVGLPLAAAMAESGFHVIGIDKDGGRITRLKCSKKANLQRQSNYQSSNQLRIEGWQGLGDRRGRLEIVGVPVRYLGQEVLQALVLLGNSLPSGTNHQGCQPG